MYMFRYYCIHMFLGVLKCTKMKVGDVEVIKGCDKNNFFPTLVMGFFAWSCRQIGSANHS